jgi:hypothetical protein
MWRRESKKISTFKVHLNEAFWTWYCSRLDLETFIWSIVLVCTNPANTETEQNLELKNSATLTIYEDRRQVVKCRRQLSLAQTRSINQITRPPSPTTFFYQTRNHPRQWAVARISITAWNNKGKKAEYQFLMICIKTKGQHFKTGAEISKSFTSLIGLHLKIILIP